MSFDLNEDFSEKMARQSVESCALDVKSWMTKNMLKLNDEKTEFLIISSKHNQSKLQEKHVQIGSFSINSSSSVRNLGAYFDNTMTMETHVKKICQSSYFQIRNIRSIRNLLSDDSAASLIHSFVTSRLDNGNCLLNGISDALLKKLQLVQNTAARVLTKTRKYDHITPVLKDLHWLPVRERIQYKILLLTWKSLHDVAPPYLKDLLIPYTPAHD